MKLSSSLSWSSRRSATGCASTASLGENLLDNMRLHRPGSHLYCGPKPIMPKRLSAHVQAFPCFPLPSSFH